ncbi:MAG: hypothetical protein PHQ14_01695 [Chromatiales bacterium]|nr:hypothetical protein [Chromatiales bacterium]
MKRLLGRGLVPLLLVIFAAVAWMEPLDRLATEQAEAGLKRAAISFATARTLNAAVSVVAGTEVQASMFVGVTLTPGQVLAPINDLIEQFSSLMLAASIAFGVQLLLMKIGASWVMSALLTVTAVGWAVVHLRGRTPPIGLSRIVIALLLVRFIMPVAALTSDLTYRQFMAEDYHSSQQAIEGSAATLRTLEGEQNRWWEFQKNIDDLKQYAARIVESTIRLAVVFLMQTLILPLLVIGVMWWAGRLLVSGAFHPRP